MTDSLHFRKTFARWDSLEIHIKYTSRILYTPTCIGRFTWKNRNMKSRQLFTWKTCRRNNQEYIFISGAQQVSFSEWGQADETDSMQHFTENDMTVLKSDAELNSKPNAEPDTGFDTQKEDAVYQTEETMYDVPVSAIASQERQQQFWEKVYQGIKEYFSDLELLGWYFNLDGDNLEISASMQQFFDATEEHGSKFL